MGRVAWPFTWESGVRGSKVFFFGGGGGVLIVP